MSDIIYEFREFRLDVRTCALRRNDHEVPLSPKEFETLLLLLESYGKPVPKESFVERLWGKNAEKEGSNLPQHIRALRKKLGQSCIHTLPNVGYRFVWEVIVIDTGIPNAPAARPLISQEVTKGWESAKRDLRFGTPGWIGVGIAATLLLGIGWLVHFLFSSRAASSSHSIAVLNFNNGSPAPEGNWLSVAIPEMLRTELANDKQTTIISGEETARAVSDLSLPKADSFSASTLRMIRRNLNADYLVLGSYRVLPTFGRMRLDIKVQDAQAGKTIMADSVTGSQSELFNLVARVGMDLRTELGLTRLSPSEAAAIRQALPATLEGTRLFAQALTELREARPLQARDLLETAAESDSRSAMIRSTLAEAWAELGYENHARENAKQALNMVSALPRESQLLLEGRYRELARDWPRSIEVYGSLWTFFPDNLEHGLRLVRVQIAAGRAQNALDTLKRIRNSRQLADDPRIDLAEAQAFESLGNFSEELKAAESAMFKASRRNNQSLLARAKLKACWALDYLGQRTRALELAQSARSIFARLGEKGNETFAIKNIADVMDDGNDHAGALPVYKDALARFREIGSQTGVVLTLNNMGYALKDKGDLDGAEASFAESARLSHDIGDVQREAQALNSLGGLYWRRGKLSLAQTSLEKAHLRFQESGDKQRDAATIGNIGLVLRDEGLLPDARQKLDQALNLSRDIGDQTGVARTVGNEGDLLLQQGDLAEAKKKYEQQLSIGNKIREDKQRAYAFFGLGEVLLEQDDLEAARARFQQSFELRTRNHENGLAAESRLGLAEVEIAKGDPRAETELKAAADQFRSEHEIDEDAEATALLVKTASMRSSHPQPGCQIESKHLNELLPALQVPSSRIQTLLAIAQCDALAGNRGNASKMAREASSLAKSIDAFGEQLETELLVADLILDPVARRQALTDVKRKAAAKGFRRIESEVQSLTSR